LQDGSTLFVATPTDANNDWLPLDSAERAAQANPSAPPNPGFAGYVSSVVSYQRGLPESFNEAVDRYHNYLDRRMPDVAQRAKAEVVFNSFEPFYNAMILYIGAFLLVCVSWLVNPWRASVRRTAFWVLIFTLLFHTAGLVARIYISGRPPVTNLYSSAI